MASQYFSSSRFSATLGGAGKVTLRGEQLVVEFQFSAARVEAIKRIPQARFNRETKVWTVPLRHYEVLRSSELFNPEQLHYTFTEESLKEGVTHSEAEHTAASQRLLANPFSIEEADLLLLELDVVFRMSPKSRSLRAFPRFRSKAKKLLEKVPRAHFLGAEKAYYFPVEGLNDFLKQLRDRKLRFAVEAGTGAILTESAELRARVLRDPAGAEGWELRSALLGPVIDVAEGEGGEMGFTFGNFTSHQLKTLFPGKMSYAARRQHANFFSEGDLLKLVARASSVGERIWLSSAVHSFLNRSRERYHEQVAESLAAGFDQALLSVADLPACWIVFDGRAGLLVDRARYESVFAPHEANPFREQPNELSAAFPGKYLFRIRDSSLAKTVERAKLVCGEDLPESSEFRALLADIRVRTEMRRQRDRYQKLEDVPASEFPCSASVTEKLYPHQRVALKWLLENPRAFLGDDMGLGKTLSVLAYFEHLCTAGEADFLLVICPNSLCRNWRREAEHWLPQRKLALLPNEKSEKMLFFKKLGWGGLLFDGVVLNYEAVRLEYILEALKGYLGKRKVLLCLDESQRVKTPSSKTFKAMSEVVPFCDRRVLLSGTPTPKDISDIWSQMRLLDDGARFGLSFYDWLGRVAELGNKYSEFGVKRFYPEEVQEVVQRVHEVLLRRKKEEVVHLPEKTFLTRDVELSGEQLKRYHEVRKDLLLRISSATGKTFVREINNILEEYLRAVQIAVNPRLVDENWKGEPAKYRELDLLLEEIVGEREEKVVVWTNFLGNVRELLERYKDYGSAAFSGEVSSAERDRTVAEFQNGKKPKVLIAVPAAGGVGITLTAAQTAIYLDKTWNAEHWLQSIDRIHRIGQRGTVRIISLHACKADDLIARNLERKSIAQAELMGDRKREPDGQLNVEGDLNGLPTREQLLEALSSGG